MLAGFLIATLVFPALALALLALGALVSGGYAVLARFVRRRLRRQARRRLKLVR